MADKVEIRTLKVSSQARPRAGYQIVTVPQLVLAGNWFKDAGFVEGAPVKLMVTDGRIEIVNEETGFYEND